MANIHRPDVEGFQIELDALIDRWSDESDLTVAETLGCLEIAKTQWLLRLYSPGIRKIANEDSPE